MKVRLLTICLLLCCGLTAFGQTFGDISGEVRDATGAVVPNAFITVANTETGATRTAATNDAGVYSFPSLPPGTYDITIQRQGFKTHTRKAVQIQVQQSARIDFTLELGQVTESVNVTAEAALLSTENATVGTVIENKRIVELPLNGRNYLQLVSLAPNVSFGFANSGQAGSRQGATARPRTSQLRASAVTSITSRSMASRIPTPTSTHTSSSRPSMRCRSSRYKPEFIPPSSDVRQRRST